MRERLRRSLANRKTKPEFFVSLTTGDQWPYEEFENLGNFDEKGDSKDVSRGKKGLPKRAYPYTITHKPVSKQYIA